MDELFKCDANYVPLSPVNFLERAAAVYCDRPSIVYERVSFTWAQTYDRCRRLASALRSLDVGKSDVVSVLAQNVPALYEMHFGVPMAGAVLNTINTRLDAPTVATILRHAEAKVFFVDCHCVDLARKALKILMSNGAAMPLVVVIDDIDAPTGIKLGDIEYDVDAPVGVPLGEVEYDMDALMRFRLGELEYEGLIASGDPNHEPHKLEDEWDPIALNYTSGTTSAPKGVVYSHRGTYLSTLSLLLQWEVGSQPVYLWTLPMFHCNGWTFTWGMAARGGTNVCIRSPAAATIYRAIVAHRVTHMCCVPVIFKNLLEATPTDYHPLPAPVHVLTGGAPPPPALLQKIERLGFHVTHAYGMTEATGPALLCEWRAEWDRLPPEQQSKLKARQGISVLSLAGVDVKNTVTMDSVARDGKSVGEIVLRGSSIMKGYFKNNKDTVGAFKDQWFLTGDLGVVHPDGYIEIKDRAKDVIISGGENISSVEVESVLYRHPAVAEAAVVAMPHPHWGETPCAFVTLKQESKLTGVNEDDIIKHCKRTMPGFMTPKKVVFLDELPKNGNGKVMKEQLRMVARRLAAAKGSRPPPQGGGAAPACDARGFNGSKGCPRQPVPQAQVFVVSRL